MTQEYRPLMEGLRIKDSPIHNQGLFTDIDIAKGHIIGMSHVKITYTEDEWIRTPLGGFVNHSDDPNCTFTHFPDTIVFSTIRDIKAGEELTAKYTLYIPSGHGELYPSENS